MSHAPSPDTSITQGKKMQMRWKRKGMRGEREEECKVFKNIFMLLMLQMRHLAEAALVNIWMFRL
jgi:hypothetical protein